MPPKAAKKPVDSNKTSEVHAGRILNLFYHAAFDDMDSLAMTPAPTTNANMKRYQTYENLCKPEEEYVDWQSRVTIAPEVKQIVVGLYNDIIAAITDIGGISEQSDDVELFMSSLNDMIDRQVWTVFTAAERHKTSFGPLLNAATDPKNWFSGRFNTDIKTNNAVMVAKISRMFNCVLKAMAYNAVIYTHYCAMSWNVGLARAFFVTNSFDTPMMLTVDSYIRERVKKPAKKKENTAETPATAGDIAAGAAAESTAIAAAESIADAAGSVASAAAESTASAASAAGAASAASVTTDVPATAATDLLTKQEGQAPTNSAEIEAILKNIL